MRGRGGSKQAGPPSGDDGDGKTPFLPLLLYVFGFLLTLALLAFVLAGLLRR